MKPNIGDGDRIARFIAGIVLLSLVLIVGSPWRWLGLIGIVPLVTAFMRWCPLYSIFGLDTCPKENNHV